MRCAAIQAISEVGSKGDATNLMLLRRAGRRARLCLPGSLPTPPLRSAKRPDCCQAFANALAGCRDARQSHRNRGTGWLKNKDMGSRRLGKRGDGCSGSITEDRTTQFEICLECACAVQMTMRIPNRNQNSLQMPSMSQTMVYVLLKCDSHQTELKLVIQLIHIQNS